MTVTEWYIPFEGSQEGRSQFVRQYKYISSVLTDAQVLDNDASEITVKLDRRIDQSEYDEINRAIHRLANEVCNAPEPERLVMWSTKMATGSRLPHSSKEPSTAASKDGASTMTGAYVHLLELLDKLVIEAYRQVGSLESHAYPPVLTVSAVKRSGYFSHHPHFMMFTTRPTSSDENYLRLAVDDVEDNSLTDTVDFESPTEAFVPAQCLHTYEFLREHRNDVLLDRLITSRGTIARYETPYADGLRRLTYYQVRELLLIGSADHVLTARSTGIRAAQFMLHVLGLQAECRKARDAFFVSESTRDLDLVQDALDAKYELIMTSDGTDEVAVASFNFAGSSLTSAFGLTEGAPSLVSGCIGFGLERLALCVAGQSESIASAIERVNRALENLAAFKEI